jgi:tRNA A37 threonylcarbamoyladenosine synthetase subunit TsaC/SUA5/YrdC
MEKWLLCRMSTVEAWLAHGNRAQCQSASPVRGGPCHAAGTKAYKRKEIHARKGPCQHFELLPDGSDVWRLEPVHEVLEAGAVCLPRHLILSSTSALMPFCANSLPWVQIGIIPTDTYPALVCDLAHPESVYILAAMKEVSPKKPMSILVRDFADIDTYTMGWPRFSSPGETFLLSMFEACMDGHEARTLRDDLQTAVSLDMSRKHSCCSAGMPDTFSVVRKLLPGSYTMILPASKAMPKVLVSTSKHRQKQRHTVGVRMPSHPVTQALLHLLDR